MDDPDYGSEVNEAVRLAALDWKEGRECSLLTLATRYALQRCSKLSRLLKHLHQREVSLEGVKAASSYVQPLSIERTDFELLAFVAAHGMGESAKLLVLRPSDLRERLDRIAHHIRQQRADPER